MRYNQLFQLKCHVQHYPWGARCRDGNKPLIAELEGLPAEKDQPFAELWIGAHPKLPAHVLIDSGATTRLDDFIAAAPDEILGSDAAKRGVDRLPFLLKVLNCETSLSIQAHPDKQSAERLHRLDPEHYPDANHKPEISISIDGLDAFCEFRPVADIRTHLARLKTLSALFKDYLTDEALSAPPREWLRAAYGFVFEMDDAEVARVIDELAAELGARDALTLADEWALRLMEQHPHDRGILSAYFLNIIHLDPEQAVFLGPNEPHSYLRGAIVECMASSDNVVRAGLTPKFIDRKTLIEMLTYDDGPPEIMTGEPLADDERVYRPPVPEFQVEFYEHDTDHVAEYKADDAVSLMLILSGEAEFDTGVGVVQAPRGSTWLWPAALKSLNCTYCQPGTVIIRARPNMNRMG